LDTYHVEAITGGTDAKVNVDVRLRRGEKVVTSKAMSEDIVMASVDGGTGEILYEGELEGH
jgi:D-citramalate synthase